MPTQPLPAITANSIFTTGSIGNISIGASGAYYNMGSVGTGAYTIAGGGTGAWSSGTYGSNSTNPVLTVKNEGVLEVTGDKADIRINGVSLKETLDNINARLGMMRPNPKIEAEWDELLELGQRYRALEAEIKDKMQMWDLLKKEY